MTTSRDRDLDRLLEDDGGELGMLYRRLPHAEPPRRLDRAVLGNAARAVRGQAPRRHRWVMAFGSVAGVVLAAGIAWHVGQDALREQSRHEGTLSAPVVVPVEPITTSRRRHADAVQSVEASAPAPMRAEPEPVAKDAQAKKAEQPAFARPAPVHEKPAVRLPPTPPPSAPAPAPSAFPPTPMQQMNAAPAAPAAAMTAAEPTATPPAQAADSLEKAAPARMRGGGAPAPSNSIELRRDTQLTADDWLAHIQQMLRQGRRQQAVESLRRFHNAHPQSLLPADLQALLE